LATHPLPDLIIVTGDVTNAGQAEEWKFFIESISQLSTEVRERMILIPGNHDLNLAHPSELSVGDGDSQLLRKVRAIRFLAAADEIQGTRAWVLCAGATRADDRIVRFRDLMAPIRSELARFIAEPPQARQRVRVSHVPMTGVNMHWVDATPVDDRAHLRCPTELWQDAFPMVVQDPRTGVLIYILDSNAIGGNIVNNAFGHLRWEHAVQLRRLERHFGAKPTLVLLHHHVALPPTSFKFARAKPINALMRRFMLMDNSSDLIAALPHTRDAVIFHGHRHVGYLGELSPNLQITSAPSTTLGDESENPRKPPGPGYSIFGVEIAANNGTKIREEIWRPVADPARAI
jgi:hypothetical protein